LDLTKPLPFYKVIDKLTRTYPYFWHYTQNINYVKRLLPICQGMLTIKVSEAEGRLKLTTKKEEEVEGGRVYIHVAKGRVGQITLVFP
jgi:hypothetical protein